MIFRFVVLIALIFSSSSNIYSQKNIEHMEPPHWWYNMENPYLEILLHGEDISNLKVTFSNKSITLVQLKPGDSPNYLFIGIDISKIEKATTFTIHLKGKRRHIKVPYSLKTKRTSSLRSSGISAKDAIYLITPDRYVNGNRENDELKEYKEGLNRSDPYGRHGGDLEGIIQSLDYINNLGFNSVWLNPVLENDMESQSYHGYATTDYYSVDKRFGSNEAYQNLSIALQARDMNLIMDMIANHCGSFHWWMKDLPFNDWINFQESFTTNYDKFDKYSNHRKSTLIDPYSSAADRKQMIEGWFAKTMPDLNTTNPHMATYIIQNSIWWVETVNLAGIRQDTYSYADKHFLSDWSCSLQEEFPNLFIVGEEWSGNPVITSQWQADSNHEMNQTTGESCLPSVMDFPMQITVSKALQEEESWNNGLASIYELLANDILYSDPFNLVIFPDNHDMDRVYTQMNESYELYKIAMTFYATMRGIPQMYYGTETLMSNKGTTSHGVIRSEFQGGWNDHQKSYFDGSGMTTKEIEAQEFISNLFNWRKKSKAIHEGKLMHFIPNNGVYVYGRYLEDEVVLVFINKNSEKKVTETTRYSELTQGYRMMENVLSQELFPITSTIQLAPLSATVYSLKK